ncbi:MAG: DNRLRE domain-containing protein, partial [Anaerolineales bacterium]|nr:DNRLRE domain-containing protein [Anaerolineales bacterium]
EEIMLSKRFFILVILILLFAVISQSTTKLTAQEETPAPPPVPVRESTRQAPSREPIILSQRATAAEQTETIIQLPVTADAYIASERPLQNFGSDSLFLGYNLLGTENYGAQRLLVRFDTSAIPETATVEEAYFRLYLTLSDPTNDEPMGTVLRRLASPWDEYDVTWNSEPDWTPIDDVSYVGSETGAWYTWQIDEVAATWISGAEENYGLEIIGDETVQQRERAFYSRETVTEFFPQLIVAYTVSDDTTPPDVLVDTLPEYVGRSFMVSWHGSDNEGGSGIESYDVQYRVDGGVWQDWRLHVTDNSAVFDGGENGRFYEFRARAVDMAGNSEPFGEAEAETTVDSIPPTSVINPLPTLIKEPTVTISWQGTDGPVGSGIQYFDVRYQVGEGNWTLWQAQTTATSALFTAPQDGTYRFEVRAVDNRNLLESFTLEPEAAVTIDAVAPFVTPRVWLPIAVSS